MSFDISTDAKFQRQAAIHAGARIAFHKSGNDSKPRRALMQRATDTTRQFEYGEMVLNPKPPKP